MSSIKWLKFTNNVINPAHIARISVSPQVIKIFLADSKDIEGFWMFGSGTVRNESHHVVEVPNDEEFKGGYNYVKRWIDELP